MSFITGQRPQGQPTAIIGLSSRMHDVWRSAALFIQTERVAGSAAGVGSHRSYPDWTRQMRLQCPGRQDATAGERFRFVFVSASYCIALHCSDGHRTLPGMDFLVFRQKKKKWNGKHGAWRTGRQVTWSLDLASDEILTRWPIDQVTLILPSNVIDVVDLVVRLLQLCKAHSDTNYYQQDKHWCRNIFQ